MTKTILVIDDDKILRDMLANGLRKYDFNALTATDASNALEILSRISVDAIVMDRMMPGIDGLTLLKQIRSSGNTTPVIMLTAMSGPDNAIDGLSGGANDYMTKPFKLQELVLRINNITANSKTPENKMPCGLVYIDDEFFIESCGTNKLLSLSKEEKKLLQNLTQPVGNIVPATPMVAKRLRNKINDVLSNIDIITVRGNGYKIITKD